MLRDIILVTVAILLILCLVAIALALYHDPVSLGCKQACAHVEGEAWKDCILLCESTR